METDTKEKVIEQIPPAEEKKGIMDAVLKSRHPEHKEEKKPEEKPKEEKKPEEKKEEKKPESKKLEEKPKEEKKPETPAQKSIDEMIAEKTGGKYKTFDDFDKYANRAERKLSERIVKLAEWEEKGIDIYDVIKYESKGYDKLNPEKIEDAKKLLFETWSEDDKGITQKELEYKFKKEYGDLIKSDEDLTDDEKAALSERKEVLQLELNRKATQAQKTLLDKKKEFEIPKNKDNQPSEQELSELIKQWKESVTPVVNEHKEEVFSVIENDKASDFKFVITDKEKENTLETMINPSSIVQRHIKDGKTDLNGLRRTAFIVENFEKVLSAYGQTRFDAGKKEVVDGIENPSKDTRGARVVDSEITNPVQAAIADKKRRAAEH